MKYLQTYENYLILEIGEIKLPPYEIDNQLDIPILGVHAKNYFFSTDSDLRYSKTLWKKYLQYLYLRKISKKIIL